MFKKIIENYNGFEEVTSNILKKGLKFCMALCILSITVLLTYLFFISYPIVYYIGINLFKFSITFSIEFIICSFITDGIKKQLI